MGIVSKNRIRAMVVLANLLLLLGWCRQPEGLWRLQAGAPRK